MKRAIVGTAGVMAALGIGLLAFAAADGTTGDSKAGTQARQGDAVADRLKRFDELDFDVFSNQKWDRLSESHADDIVVTWPDGHRTKGIQKHIEDLKGMFVYAPDTRIAVHPIKFGSGEWTCVTGVMTGTFSRPMPTPDGKTIPPTQKPFKITMATIARWKDGKMIEESLFWDNQDFLRQIGLAR